MQAYGENWVIFISTCHCNNGNSYIMKDRLQVDEYKNGCHLTLYLEDSAFNYLQFVKFQLLKLKFFMSASSFQKE